MSYRLDGVMVWLKAKAGTETEPWEHSYAWLARRGFDGEPKSRERTEFLISQVDPVI